MKKKVLFMSLVAVLVISAVGMSFAYGGYGHMGGGYGHMGGYGYNNEGTALTEEEWEERHDEMQQWNLEALEKQLEDGPITEEQYDAWVEHFEYMDEFHETMGYGGFGGGYGYGGCHRYQ